MDQQDPREVSQVSQVTEHSININTTPDTDRQNAQVTQTPEGKVIAMQGSLSEVLRRALDVMFDKRTDTMGGVSIEHEAGQPDVSHPANVVVMTVVEGAVTAEDVVLFSQLIATGETDRLRLLIIRQDVANARCTTLERLAAAREVAVYTSCETLLEDLKSSMS